AACCSNASSRSRVRWSSSSSRSAIDAGAVGALRPLRIALWRGPFGGCPLTPCRFMSSQAVHDDAQSYANLGFRATVVCPLWVKSRHVRFTPESRRQADDLYMVVAGSELGFDESGEGKNLRLRPLHPNLFQNRLELLPEPIKGDSRLPNIDHAPPARHRSGNVCKYSPNRPVG